jgi:hypothetical protein
VTASATDNIEGLSDFDLGWSWATNEHVESGFTAVVRVKNESAPLPWILPPLLRAVERVVLVDNGSTDDTIAVAKRTAAEAALAERLDVRSYPFAVSRCGPEHLDTPADSVHSLTYFYNWSFSLVRTSYALKWDGDMLLTELGVRALQDMGWQLEAVQRVMTMLRYPLYVADERTAFLDLGIVNKEPWAWPNGPEFTHTKAFEWELPRWPSDIQMVSLPDWSCLELKFLDADEFAHWSHDDFTTTTRTTRKQREQAIFRALAGGTEPPAGVVRVDSPDDRHVIEYVRSEWVPTHRDEMLDR